MGEQGMRTPPWLFDHLQEFFGLRFGLDAAATGENTLCKRFHTERHSALHRRWRGPTFCNHPFMLTDDFVRCANEMAQVLGETTIMLAPVIGSQEWAHQVAIKWTIYQPDKRISYHSPDGTPKPGADRDTSIIAFGPGFENKGDGFRVLPMRMPTQINQQPARIQP